MLNIWVCSLLSVFFVSLVSFIGIFTLGIKVDRLRKVLIYIISFAAGALIGDVFLHLLPHSIEEHGFGLSTSFGVLGGIILFLIVEKVIQWKHCHGEIIQEGHVHSFAYMNLIGDGVHNFLDGVIIAAAFLVNIPAGIATTIAVALHEIPQEIGDFGVLLHGGFSKSKALFLNFVSALTAVLGAVITLILAGSIEQLEIFLIPIAAGGFIYIAGSDLIPEINKHSEKLYKAILQIIAFLIGIGIISLLLFLE